jgi:hypothetical protein
MSKYVVSANYLDRESELKWLVRREDEPVSQATAHRSVLCRGVKFQLSSEGEKGFGCRVVAIVDEVELDAESLPEGGPLEFDFNLFRNAIGCVVKAVNELALTPDGAVLEVQAAVDSEKA